MDLFQQIGRIIQQRRSQIRITQGQLADMAEISINTLYKIERGQGNPTLQSLFKIADILGLELVLQVKQKEKKLGNETGGN
ncbi:MAG: helix-turn-helix domain-containing protein [Bacteroidota bacterium]